MEQTIIKLSQEELLFALRVIDETRILGMDGTELAKADEATLNALTDAGGRALMARDLLTSGDNGQLIIDQGVYATVMVCAHPERMVSLAVLQQGQMPRQMFFYRVPEIAVTHMPLADGLHRFEIAEDSDMGLLAITQALEGLPDNNTHTPPQLLNEEDLTVAAELAPIDSAGAQQYLETAGMLAPDAQRFSAALARVTCTLLIQIVYRLQPTVEQVLLKLVADTSACWLASSDTEEPGRIIVQQVSHAMIDQTLRQLFQPFSVRLVAK